MQIVNPKPLQS